MTLLVRSRDEFEKHREKIPIFGWHCLLPLGAFRSAETTLLFWGQFSSSIDQKDNQNRKKKVCLLGLLFIFWLLRFALFLSVIRWVLQLKTQTCCKVEKGESSTKKMTAVHRWKSKALSYRDTVILRKSIENKKIKSIHCQFSQLVHFSNRNRSKAHLE